MSNLFHPHLWPSVQLWGRVQPAHQKRMSFCLSASDISPSSGRNDSWLQGALEGSLVTGAEDGRWNAMSIIAKWDTIIHKGVCWADYYHSGKRSWSRSEESSANASSVFSDISRVLGVIKMKWRWGHQPRLCSTACLHMWLCARQVGMGLKWSRERQKERIWIGLHIR